MLSIRMGINLVQLPCHKDKLASVNSNHRAALNVLGHVVTDLEKKVLYKQYLKMFKNKETESILELFHITNIGIMCAYLIG